MELMNKKAFSIGTIIIIISIIITVAIISTLIISTSHKYSYKAENVKEGVKKGVSTQLSIVRVDGISNRTGEVNYLEIYAKPVPGSDPILTTSINIDLITSRYALHAKRSNLSEIENTIRGYISWRDQEFGRFTNYYELVDGVVTDSLYNLEYVDLNLDGRVDNITVCNSAGTYCPASYDGKYLAILISGGEKYYVAFKTKNGSIIDIFRSDGEEFYVINESIGNYGYITIRGIDDGGLLYRINPNKIKIYTLKHSIKADLDEDYKTDYLAIQRDQVWIFLSSKQEVLKYDLGDDISSVPATFNKKIELYYNGKDYGTLIVKGSTNIKNILPEDVYFHLNPWNSYKGYFAIEKIQGNNSKKAIFENDVVKIYLELPAPIYEDETSRLSIVLSRGIPNYVELRSPKVINTARVKLY